VGVGGERLLSGVVEGGGGGGRVLALRGGVQQEPVECVEELGLALVELGVAARRLVASVGERGGAGVHDVREGGLEEGPAADAVDGVGEAGRQAVQDVLDQHFFEVLRACRGNGLGRGCMSVCVCVCVCGCVQTLDPKPEFFFGSNKFGI